MYQEIGRLLDDGCPNLDGHEFSECPECVQFWCRIWEENYTVYYKCLECGFEGHDYYEDLYGCMSVPWGYL